MAELETSAPARGLGLPLVRRGCRLEALDPGPVWQVSPYPGRLAALDKALKPLGFRFPQPGEVLAGKGGARLVWAGRESAFLIGAAAPEGLPAALVDQSDGWVALHIEGAAVLGVLARLVAVDLRDQALAAPASLRSQLGHLPVLIIKNAPQAFEIWSYRSMAASLVHELDEAMRGVAARSETGSGQGL